MRRQLALCAAAAAAAVALAACRVAVPPAKPSGVVVLISATAEWTAVRAHFPAAAVHAAPHGDWFAATLAHGRATFFHGGWGKVAAASSTQYAIDTFHPALLVNLGTAGGFPGHSDTGDVILVGKTIIYDIVERMGDPAEAIADYATTLTTPARWPARLASSVRVATLVSADGDLDPAQVAALGEKYGAVGGDWESGAIAWVAARNAVPVLILRGISDVVRPTGDVTYGSQATWEQVAKTTMDKLLALFDDALPDLAVTSAAAPAAAASPPPP